MTGGAVDASMAEHYGAAWLNEISLGSGDPLAIVSASGIVEFWNRAAEESTGLRADAAQGRPLAALLTADGIGSPIWAAHFITVGSHLGGFPPCRRRFHIGTYEQGKTDLDLSSVLVRHHAKGTWSIAYIFQICRTRNGPDEPAVPEDILGLSPREWEVLSLLMAGVDTKGIGVELGIQYSTVRGHIRNVLAHLGVQNRSQALVKVWSTLGGESIPRRL